jgi:hypothetical protein
MGQILKKRIGVKQIGLQQIKLGCQSFSVGQVRGIVVEEFHGAFFEIVSFADFEENLFEFFLKMFRLAADSLLLEEVSSGLVFWLHLAFNSVLIAIGFVFLVFFILLQLVVEYYVILEFVLIITEERVFDDVGETHTLLAVDHEDPLEEILQFSCLIFQFFLLRKGGC